MSIQTHSKTPTHHSNIFYRKCDVDEKKYGDEEYEKCGVFYSIHRRKIYTETGMPPHNSIKYLILFAPFQPVFLFPVKKQVLS